ncbi:Zinc finger, CCHC-type [Sesbania bispinosa]|nr:Zinc finger, CCHC-type [Sesbania bispinosa]
MSEIQEPPRRSLGEDDQVQRSTKRIKDNSSSVMDAEDASKLKSGSPQKSILHGGSYKDKVMEIDSNFNFQPEEIVRMVTEELFPDMDHAKNNENIRKEFNSNPTVNVELEEYEQWCNPWKYSLIVKLMGKRMGLRFMSSKLKFLWTKNGDVRIMDISDEFFMVRFSDEGDYKHALYEGPWLIADHYLLVQRWRPLFTPKDYEVKKIAVWVRIPHLPVEFYNPHFLWRPGDQLGTMLKIDETTSIHTRSRFARICIEIDLRDQLIPYFNALGKTFKAEYESLHMICFECGKYGHRLDFCPERTSPPNLDKDFADLILPQSDPNKQSKVDPVQEPINTEDMECNVTSNTKPEPVEPNHKRQSQYLGPGCL